MEWAVEFDAAFSAELEAFPDTAEDEILVLAGLLRRFGPQLCRPYCDTLNGSKYPNMKELRLTVTDGEWRVAFAFDPDRHAILLVGGSQSGTNQRRFYRDLIRVADSRFEQHLQARKGG